jgi:uncharacterized protein (DUF2141 family)
MTLAFRLPGLALALVLTGSAANAQQSSCTGPATDTRLYVQVEGVRASQGLVAVSLYADESSKFLARRGSIYTGRVPAEAPSTTVCLHLPEPGIYALAAYHDEDGDRSLDRGSLGLPTEGVGFSNNPRLVLSLPSFRSVRLSVPRTNMLTRITLRYP